MPLLGNILTLFSDKKKTKPVFPVTKVKAVSNDEGVGLDAILENMVYTGVNNGEETTAPLNADTLGGRPAEDFATQNYVATEIAKAQLDGSGDIDLSGFATHDDITNAVNAIDFPVDSVNGKTGAVTLSASDIGAVSKNGDTYTGILYRKGAAGAMGLAIGTEAIPECISIISVGDGTEYNRFCFRQYGKNGKRENYNLPTTTEPAQNINYEIVTSRSAKVLWTNASPKSSFAAQTVTISGLKDCSCIAVLLYKTEGNGDHFLTIQHNGVSGTLSTTPSGVRSDAGTLYESHRSVTTNFTNGTIYFGKGFQNNTENNARAIPAAVIGLY